jgi:hypothetical protein
LLESHRHSLNTFISFARREPCDSNQLAVLRGIKHQLTSNLHNQIPLSPRPIISTHVFQAKAPQQLDLSAILVPNAAIRSPTPPHPSAGFHRPYSPASSGLRDNSSRQPLAISRHVLWRCRHGHGRLRCGPTLHQRRYGPRSFVSAARLCA